MVYAFALTSPPYDSCLQTDNGKIVNIKKKIIKILEKQLVCAYLTFILLLAVAPSVTSSEYQKYVLKTLRLLKDTSAANLIEKLGESSTVSEKLTYQVISFIQKIHLSWKN